MAVTRECDDLDKGIELLVNDGYRLDMIMPADAPREVQLSKSTEIIRLVLSRELVKTPPKGGTQNYQEPFNDGTQNSEEPHKGETQNGWTMGRAGMLYRDLMPDRMGGRMAVSHICLTEGGPVPDYVHYHKIEFQMIRCIAGRIRVVYEDQGEPFWLEPGDWVIQPPEIRHRVLECEAGSEVIEISMPAEHETWVDHELTLPTSEYLPDRDFSGQQFVRYIAKHHRG
jgi:quercetin dioxygenase-like cupin family protein